MKEKLSGISRRHFLRLSAASPLAFSASGIVLPSAWARTVDERRTVHRIAFGSCAEQDHAQPIWDVIADTLPDMFIFCGDNIYADTEDMALMAQRYQLLAAQPAYARFRARIPVLATWDDHDFGINDGGKEYPKKEESKRLMLDFFGEPAGSERRKRPGVYTSYMFGPRGKAVQIILLDLRTFRDPLIYDATIDGYVPTRDLSTTMMGEAQWSWLERQLAEPADLRLIVSSTQFLPVEHKWEKWANFPHEQIRMLKLLDRLSVKNAVVLSGDMHYGELSEGKTPAGTAVHELTSSGLNLVESAAAIPNSSRVALHDTTPNFGLVEIAWHGTTCGVSLQVRSDKGSIQIRRDISL